MKHEEIIGKKFNKLTVLEHSHVKDKYWHFYKCLCECGNFKTIRYDSIMSGSIKSCGCLLKENKVQRKDIAGIRFGRLVAIEYAFFKNKATYWKCKCDCGNEKTIPIGSLLSGDSKSCGCLYLKVKNRNLIGQKFGKLTVLRYSNLHEQYWYYYDCLCDCGNIKSVHEHSLIEKKTRSCGCLNIAKNKTHGKSTTPEYATWHAMIDRCNNDRNKRYKNYGGRGIVVCDRWLFSFENFLNDMGIKPSKQHSVERVKNNDGYYPENCIWATASVQNRNHRRNLNIEYNGEKMCLMDWSKKIGIEYATLRSRIREYKWSIKRSFETPVEIRNRKYKINE